MWAALLIPVLFVGLVGQEYLLRIGLALPVAVMAGLGLARTDWLSTRLPDAIPLGWALCLTAYVLLL